MHASGLGSDPMQEMTNLRLISIPERGGACPEVCEPPVCKGFLNMCLHKSLFHLVFLLAAPLELTSQNSSP